jgi:heme exporter protein D
MIRILRHPATNAICIGLFTAFYGAVFLAASRRIVHESLLYYGGTKQGVNPLWNDWCAFLATGHHAYIAYVMIAITLLIVVLLSMRRHPYDEYHTALLINSLALAAVLTLIAIAVFYLLILSDPNGIVVKFTLFISIHWTSVVLSDLVYVLLSRWG